MTSLILGEFSPQEFAKLRDHSDRLDSLSVRGKRWFSVPEVQEIDLSGIVNFTCLDVYEVCDYSWLSSFRSLKAFKGTDLSVGALRALASMTWCDPLESVNLNFLLADPEGAAWTEFWNGRSVAWRSLRLSGLGWRLQTALTEGRFLQLKHLFVGQEFDVGEFRSAFGSAQLPELIELEVHGEGVSVQEIEEFLESFRNIAPNLQRLYVTISSGELEQDNDGWYDTGSTKYVPYSRAQFERRFLEPYGLKAGIGWE